jgi:hypothetical protein
LTTETDIANKALSAIGTRSQIASLNEQSNEAIQANLLIESVRDEIIRMAPWNSATNFNTLALICAAPGTPENPSSGTTTWQKGQPLPPWAYEYAYPADCLRPLYIVPQFTTGFASGVPITTAVTGGAPSFWNGPPIKFKVAIDQITNGVPAVGGADTKIILTNQEDAILVYLKRLTDPDVMDEQLQQAWISALAARLAIPLTGDKGLANLKIKEANDFIMIARVGDGNEGLTINNVTPDWIRTRGIDYPTDYGWTPNVQFNWGGFLSMY